MIRLSDQINLPVRKCPTLIHDLALNAKILKHLKIDMIGKRIALLVYAGTYIIYTYLIHSSSNKLM